MNRSITHRPRLLAPALLSGAILLAALVPVILQAPPAAAAAAAAAEACADGSGVTVVVDFTDVGGEVVTGCAPSDPATGREALEAAGFTPTDSQAGFICAINAAPDPCPETFDGSFWAYWHSTVDGEWTSYSVGADSSDPAPGELEGWRYNDGSVGPGIAPADAANALPSAESEAGEADSDAADSDPAVVPSSDTVLLIVLGVAAVGIVAVVVIVTRSRRQRGAGNR